MKSKKSEAKIRIQLMGGTIQTRLIICFRHYNYLSLHHSFNFFKDNKKIFKKEKV